MKTTFKHSGPRALRPILLTSLVLGLAACGQQPDTKASQAEPVTAASSSATADMSAMPISPAGERTGTGVGTIMAVDPENSRITIAHDPIPDVDWPAMNMGFAASPALVAQANVGDRIEFDLTVKGNAAQVTALRPR